MYMLLPLRALKRIRPVITTEDDNMIACTVVTLRLDYANALLHSVTSKNIIRLQRIKKALARCVVDDSN